MWENCPSVLLVEAFKYCAWKSREKVQLVCRRWGTIILKDEIPEWKTDFIEGENVEGLIENVRLADNSICFNTIYQPQIAFIHVLGSDSCSKQILEMLEEKLRLKLPLDCVLLCTYSAGSVISTRNNSENVQEFMARPGRVGVSITTVFMPRTFFQVFSIARHEIESIYDLSHPEIAMHHHSSKPTFEINSFLVWNAKDSVPMLVNLLRTWKPEASIAEGEENTSNFLPTIAYRCPIGSQGTLCFGQNIEEGEHIVLMIGGEGGISTVSSMDLEPCSNIIKSSGHSTLGSEFIYTDVITEDNEQVPIVDAIRNFIGPDLDVVEQFYVVQANERSVLERFQYPLNRPELRDYYVVRVFASDDLAMFKSSVDLNQLWEPQAWSQLYKESVSLNFDSQRIRDYIERAELNAVGAYMFNSLAFPNETIIDDFRGIAPLIGCGFPSLCLSYRVDAQEIAIFWSKSFKRTSCFL